MRQSAKRGRGPDPLQIGNQWVRQTHDINFAIYIGVKCGKRCFPNNHPYEMTEMTKFFKELRRSNEIIYTNLISACASCGQWPAALSLLHSMSTIQVTPNVVTCTAALGAYVTSGYWHGALQLLRSLVGQVDGSGAISGEQIGYK